jgi:hypothetical protein
MICAKPHLPKDATVTFLISAMEHRIIAGKKNQENYFFKLLQLDARAPIP